MNSAVTFRVEERAFALGTAFGFDSTFTLHASGMDNTPIRREVKQIFNRIDTPLYIAPVVIGPKRIVP